MKKQFSLFTILGIAIIFATAMPGCAPKLKPLPESAVKATPQPLERVGQKIPAELAVNFPAGWFHKKALLRVTPVYHFAGRTQSAPGFTFQGEKVKNNYTVINKQNGGAQTFNVSFPYEPAMAQGELFLYLESDFSGKKRNLPPIKVATGTVTTMEWADATGATPAFAPDGFSRIVKENYSTDIRFLIQQAEVRAQELRKKEVSEWKDVVESAQQLPNHEVEVEVQAYASPDGGVELNEKLSAQREKNTTSALKKELNKYNIPFSAHYTSQDWDGFQKLLEQSNIPDKELVLRVLSMYTDPEEREKEIKNLSFVFRQLADEILPQLRRSRLTAHVTVIGKSDEELLDLAKNRPGRLKADELLYAATLTSDIREKEAFYRSAIQLYPSDYRALNNLGALLLQSGEIAEAAPYFDRAVKAEKNGYSYVNQALISLHNGEIEQAKLLVGKAAELPEAEQAMGLMYLSEGKIQQAAEMLGKTPSRNGAVSQIMSHHYGEAAQTLEALPQNDATVHYLKAIVAARTQRDTLEVAQHLSKAIALNPKLAHKAAQDLEFVAYKDLVQQAKAMK